MNSSDMILEERENNILLFEKYKNFLTQTQKQALYFYWIEDLSLAEISKIVATTRSAVYDAIKKGEKKLKQVERKMIL